MKKETTFAEFLIIAVVSLIIWIPLIIGIGYLLAYGIDLYGGIKCN